MKVSFRSIPWSNSCRGGSFPSPGSLKTLAYLVYCGGSFCSTLSVACAKAVESVSFLIWGWSSPSTHQSVTIIFPYQSILLIIHSHRLLTWRGSGSVHLRNTTYLLVHSPSTFSLVSLSHDSSYSPHSMIFFHLPFSSFVFTQLGLCTFLIWLNTQSFVMYQYSWSAQY